jgi:predicted nucleic acid-binding protein
MSCAKIVVNASPIISLAKIGYADLLSDLSSELVIPQGVVEEIVAYRQPDLAVEWVRRQNPACIKPVKVPAIIAEWNLGKGESQVIAYAYQNREFIASIDDKPAKKSAELFGIKVSGTLAIIIKAKKAGLIPSVLPLLLKLQANGFRVADDVFASALRLSGERGNINL